MLPSSLLSLLSLSLLLSSVSAQYYLIANPTNPVAPAAGSSFGQSVAAYGSLVAVGANMQDVAPWSSVGSVSLFWCTPTSTPTSCSFIGALSPVSTQSSYRFGSAIAVSANYVVAVSVPGEYYATGRNGVVFLFSCSMSGCTGPMAHVTTSDEADFDEFSSALAWSVTDPTILVTSSSEKNDLQGEVYLFSCTNSCTQGAIVTAVSPAFSDYFGCAVGMTGTVLVVGAYGRSSSKGAVFVYTCSSYTTCDQGNLLSVPTLTDGAQLGKSIAIGGPSNDMVFVSAQGQTVTLAAQGAVFAYSCAALPCTFGQPIVASNPSSGSNFGVTLAASGKVLAVGATAANSNNGIVYIFNCASLGNCEELHQLTAVDGATGDHFGSSVALSGPGTPDTAVIVGTPDKNSQAGEVYIFSSQSPVPVASPTPTPSHAATATTASPTPTPSRGATTTAASQATATAAPHTTAPTAAAVPTSTAAPTAVAPTTAGTAPPATDSPTSSASTAGQSSSVVGAAVGAVFGVVVVGILVAVIVIFLRRRRHQEYSNNKLSDDGIAMSASTGTVVGDGYSNDVMRDMTGRASGRVDKSGTVKSAGSAAALSALMQRDVATWTVKDVALWLTSVQVTKQAVKSFERNNINGQALVMLKSEDQVEKMGVKAAGDRLILLNAIQNLLPDSESVPRSLSRSGSFADKSESNVMINRKDLLLGEILASGNFGRVLKGTFRGALVAVKQPSATNAETNEDFVEEARLMKSIPAHPNVVQYFGICVTSSELYLVMEYCDLGSLQTYIRNNTDLSPKTLVNLCAQVAAGMSHLANFIVHRDLAARNILVSSTGGGSGVLPRIADFGLSRPLNNDGYMRTGGRHPIPIPWTATEVLHDAPHTPAADVWSFGVVMWEIFMGCPAAPPQPNRQSMPTLPKPPKCPDNVFAVMTHCWAITPSNRPTFDQVFTTLSTLH